MPTKNARRKLGISAAVGSVMEFLENRRLLSISGPTSGVEIDTNLGNMFVQLRPDVAPATVANFLNYVDSQRYDGTIIHRITTVANDGLAVIQGGGFTVVTDPNSGVQTLQPITADAPIADEASLPGALPNIRGTIAMAKTSAANSATDQWFINTADNSAVLSPQAQSNGGFTAFGTVIYGLNVADAINALRVVDASSTLGSDASSLPVTAKNQFITVSTIKEDQLLTVVIGDGIDNSVTFTDADGTVSTISIAHGSATIDFTGTGLSASSTGGVITLSGTGVNVQDITTSGTSLATHLTATGAGGDGKVQVVNLTTAGPLGSISASALALSGTYTTNGTLNWTSPSHDSTHPEKTIPASVNISGATSLAFQFDAPVGITQTAGRSVVNGTANIANISAKGTTARSVMKVSAAPHQFVNISGFDTDGSLASIIGPQLNIVGPFTLQGTLTQVNVVGINGGSIIIVGTGAKAQALTVISPNNSDANIVSAIPIKALLIRNGWITSSSGSSLIQAPNIQRLECLANFGATLHLTNASATMSLVKLAKIDKSQWVIAGNIGTMMITGTIADQFNAEIDGSVNTIKTGDITSENTSVQGVSMHTAIHVKGNVKSVVTGNMINGLATDASNQFTDSGFQGTIDGNVGTITGGIFSGDWTFKTAKTIKFKSLNNGFLTSTAPFSASTNAIGTVAITGAADHLFVQSAGNIGAISAAKLDDRSRIFAGIVSNQNTINSLPTTVDGYAAQATIGSVQTRTMINTLIAAWHLKKLSLGTITLSNVGVPFGLAANQIDSITATGDNGQNLSFKSLDDPAALAALITQRGLNLQDFQIDLV